MFRAPPFWASWNSARRRQKTPTRTPDDLPDTLHGRGGSRPLQRDLQLAEQALGNIRQALALLETFPFACRKAREDEPRLRELLIPFGNEGYVALYEIDDATTVTLLAFRHQREDDYH